MNSDHFSATQSVNDHLNLALAEILDGITKLAELRADQQSAPDLSPMVPSYIGEIRFGTSSANAMTITSAEAGLVGMGGNDTLTGGAADDFLIGDYFDVRVIADNPGDIPYDASVIGNDLIYGGDGTDLIEGGIGNDGLFGGDGDDYFAMYEQDVGIDTFRGGAGWDQIDFYDGWDLGYTFVNLAALDLSAAASVEELLFGVELQGTAADNIFDLSGVQNYAISGMGDTFGFFDLLNGNDRFTGGIAAESVMGGNGNDTLIGGGGNDSLNGGAGDDSLVGGKGNDEYDVNISRDAVQELANQGTDIVRTTLSIYTLGANVENLTSIGSAGFKGTGNTLKNTITGNNFNDTLNGGLGNDTLNSFGGNDVFLFNTALGSSNVDTVTDFKPGFDLIHLENTGTGLFNKIRAGELTEAAFKITTPQSAVDADDRIIYNAATGRLIYDADGSGSGVGITFAFLTPNLALTASDFLVI